MIFILTAFLLGTMNTAEPGNLDRPLTELEKKISSDHFPILIAPDFVNQRDNLVFFDYDGTLDVSDNGKSKDKLKEDSPAGVDWSLIENGGAYSLNVMFHRPVSRGVDAPIIGKTPDRMLDTESASILIKKRKIGPSAEVGFESAGIVVFGNAHGAAAPACTPGLNHCLPPDFVNKGIANIKFNGDSKAQASARERTVDLLGGRVVLVSEPYTHAIVPVTDLDLQIKLLNENTTEKGQSGTRLANTVIYYPEGSDKAELEKRFSGAKSFQPYKIREKELNEILYPNAKEIVAGPEITTDANPNSTDWWDRTVELKPGLSYEFQVGGKKSGANGFWGWGILDYKTHLEAKTVPANHKDGLRYLCTSVGLITDKCLPGFFNAEEIQSGALKTIRNPWYRVKQ